MEKKSRGKFKSNALKTMPIKQFSDLPAAWGPSQGTPQSPESHPVNNLAARGSIPLGQSGAQMMSTMDANLNQSNPDIPGGGNTGRI